MEAHPISEYFLLGSDVRYLVSAHEDSSLFGEKVVLWVCRRLRKACEQARLYVTLRLMDDQLGRMIREWETEEQARQEDTPNRCLTQQEAEALSDAAFMIEATLKAESGGMFAFVAGDKRFEVRKLLSDVASLMSPGVFDALPEVARYDFGEAGRCIAFEAPTAAAFHLMRGTEDVLKWFYCTLVNTDRCSLMWGPMVSHLTGRNDGPPEVLLTLLNSLRINYRNPTQHPEKIYDIEEVQDLLVLSIDVVNRMVKLVRPELAIPKPSKSPGLVARAAIVGSASSSANTI